MLTLRIMFFSLDCHPSVAVRYSQRSSLISTVLPDVVGVQRPTPRLAQGSPLVLGLLRAAKDLYRLPEPDGTPVIPH